MKDSIVECAISPNGYATVCEVGKDFTFFDLLYSKERELNYEGKIWKLKDYQVRLGVIKLGEMYSYLVMQVEYFPNSFCSNIKLIYDFLKQVLTDDHYKGFTSRPLKTFIQEISDDEGRLVEMKLEGDSKQEFKNRDLLFQFVVPLLQ